NVIDGGYVATVSSLTSPLVGKHLLTITGPLPKGCEDGIGHVFVVDTTADEVDRDASDDLCRTKAGDCSLRAAVMQANASPGHDIIRVRSGTYVLGLTGEEDLDAPDVTIGD